MANNPISPVITLDNPNVEGPGSGMEGGSSDSIIGIATDVINPTLSSFPRIEVGARSSPIGLPPPSLGAAAYYVDYENNSFDRSPIIFAEADNDAAVGEIFATTLNFAVTNESSREIKIGEWLWGVAVPSIPEVPFYTTGPDVLISENEWQTNGDGVVQQDTNEFIRFIPTPTKVECWNSRFSPGPINAYPPMVIGARYRMEVTIGDNTTGGPITCLLKNFGNSDSPPTPLTLTANTLGVDQSFEFVANGNQHQVNIQVNPSGYIQCGEVTIIGPIAT
jgi:hypothetical protein